VCWWDWPSLRVPRCFRMAREVSFGHRHCSNLSRNLSRRPGGPFPCLTRIIKAVLLLGSRAILSINWDCICFSVRGLGWLKLGFDIQKSTATSR